MTNKDQIKCFECDTIEDIEHHHVVPRVLGGTRTIPLCSSCHCKVHDRKKTNISKLTTEGLAKMRKNNKLISGFIPYGYDLAKNKKDLTKNKQEQKNIRKMKKLRNKGMTPTAIAKFFNEKKIRTKNNKEFFASTVRKILERWDNLHENRA